MEEPSHPHTPAQKERSFSNAYVLEDENETTEPRFNSTRLSGVTYVNPTAMSASEQGYVTVNTRQADNVLSLRMNSYLGQQLKFQFLLLVGLILSVIINIILTAVVVHEVVSTQTTQPVNCSRT